MPVEIRELHIRVSVKQEAGKQGGGEQGGAAQGGGAGGQGGHDDLVAQCVDQVLDILQAKKER